MVVARVRNKGGRDAESGTVRLHAPGATEPGAAAPVAAGKGFRASAGMLGSADDADDAVIEGEDGAGER
jgi:hypothetical protein